MQTHVSLTIQDDVVMVTFACDVPGKPTTLDYTVLDELEQAVTQIERRVDTLHVVVLDSASPKYFVVGANINALADVNAQTIPSWVKRGHTGVNRLEALPLPVIALVKGYALGGGLELAMACDIILAEESAQFGQPEANLGLVSGWGGSYRLPRRVGLAQAKLMFFTGRAINASEALRIGLVDYVGDTEVYLDALLADIRKLSPVAVAEMKQLLVNSVSRSLLDNAGDEAEASAACLNHPDTQQRVRTYLESRRQKS